MTVPTTAKPHPCTAFRTLIQSRAAHISPKKTSSVELESMGGGSMRSWMPGLAVHALHVSLALRQSCSLPVLQLLTVFLETQDFVMSAGRQWQLLQQLSRRTQTGSCLSIWSELLTELHFLHCK